MPEKTQLEVGDRIYSHSYGVYSGPYLIDRVTATQAFIKGTKLKRALDGRWIREIGGQRWNSTSYHLETPEIKETVRVKNIKSTVSRFNFASLPLEKLERILSIISEPA